MTKLHVVTHEVQGDRFVAVFTSFGDAHAHVCAVLGALSDGEDWLPANVSPGEYDEAWCWVRKDSLDSLWVDEVTVADLPDTSALVASITELVREVQLQRDAFYDSDCYGGPNGKFDEDCREDLEHFDGMSRRAYALTGKEA